LQSLGEPIRQVVAMPRELVRGTVQASADVRLRAPIRARDPAALARTGNFVPFGAEKERGRVTDICGGAEVCLRVSAHRDHQDRSIVIGGIGPS